MSALRRPVVLIHGALRGRAGLLPTAAFLRARGFDARPFAYAARRDTLEEHGARLERFLAAWLDGPVETLGLLTHSMGGLVARAYLEREGARAQSARQRLVMLAPPNRGSRLAALHGERAAFRRLYGRAGEELQAARVARLSAPPPSCATLVLAGGTADGRGFNRSLPGNDDGVVALEETALAGSEPRLVGGLHSFLQWRPSVLDQAVDFLRG